LAGNARAAENAELEGSGLHVVATLPGLVFGQTDASNLRVTVCTCRNLVVVDLRVILPGDALGEHDAFCRRQVRQLRVPRLIERDDIADGGDAGPVRSQISPAVHVPALETKTCLLRSQARRDGATPGGDEQ